MALQRRAGGGQRVGRVAHSADEGGHQPHITAAVTAGTGRVNGGSDDLHLTREVIVNLDFVVVKVVVTTQRGTGAIVAHSATLPVGVTVQHQNPRSAALELHVDDLVIYYIVVTVVDAATIRPGLQRPPPTLQAGVLGDNRDGPTPIIKDRIQAGYQAAGHTCERGVIEVGGGSQPF